MQRTKIVATVGPASESPDVLRRMILAGVDVVRLNFSHGTHQWHSRAISQVRKIADELARPVAIMQDLQGPKIRTGPLRGGESVELEDGKQFVITSRQVEGSSEAVSSNYERLPEELKSGDRILIDDGAIELRVAEVAGEDVRCEIVRGGVLRERRGINLPGADISVTSPTEKDGEDLAFGLAQGVDYVALSFVRSAKDVERLRTMLEEAGKGDTPIIAKIETPEAIDHLDEVVAVADGVMVARGDLAVETSPDKVPVYQKRIIAAANSAGKLAITATQMLESMTDKLVPTRAEATDVANAIYDGSDAVMLSAETSLGSYPVQAVEMMDRIAKTAEVDFREYGRVTANWDPGEKSYARATIRAACFAASQSDANAIVVFTESGRSARLLSLHRPGAPIFALTSHDETYRRLALVWGVQSFLMRHSDNVDSMLLQGEEVLLKQGAIKKGDHVIFVVGTFAIRGATNLIKVHLVSEENLAKT